MQNCDEGDWLTEVSPEDPYWEVIETSAELIPLLHYLSSLIRDASGSNPFGKRFFFLDAADLGGGLSEQSLILKSQAES
jgi:hypothetical protein